MNNKSKSYNLKEDFEAVYLRMRTLKRFMGLADPAITGSLDFKKVIKFKSESYWRWGTKIFQPNGFEYEDLESIVTAWSYGFAGIKRGIAPSKELFNHMMKFLDQRFQNMTDWTWKKFGLSERIGQISMDGQLTIDDEDGRKAIEIRSASTLPSADFMNYRPFMSQEEWFDSRQPTKEDPQSRLVSAQIAEMKLCELKENTTKKSELIRDQLREIKLRIREIRRGERKGPYRLERRTLYCRLRALQLEAATMDAKRTQEAVQVDCMRARLHQDPIKYKDQLCHYASTKHVQYDVRKKARQICAQYGIDYINWATRQIRELNVPANNFDIRIPSEQ